MDANKKSIEAGGGYFESRACLCQGSCIEVGELSFDFKQILFYELAPLPPSLFNKENVLRAVKHKSNLMKTLKVEFNARLLASNTTATFVDDSAVFGHAS